MSIQTSEIKLYKSITVNDTSANGGRMSTTQVTPGVTANVWPNVPQSERAAGSTKYRKVFFKVANDDDLALLDANVFVEKHTPGEDRVMIFPGTQTNTQGDISSPRLFGCGQLDANVSIGATSLAVNTEAAADDIFQDGDLIRISDQDGINGVGNVDYVRLAATNAVSWNGDKATLTFDTGQSLANAYTAASTRVSSCIEVGDVRATVTNWSETSAAGTYDEATYPVAADAIGSIDQTVTITFTSATAFTCTGSITGSMGSGTTGSNFAPNNTDFSKPYFTLQSAGWGGTWATNDTLVFQTHPAAVPIWEKRIVPAGCASLSGNTLNVAIVGESE